METKGETDMAYVSMYQDLKDNDKLFTLAAKLDVSPAHASGNLFFLWAWALDHTKGTHGDLTGKSSAVVARAAGWEGDHQLFFDAMVDSGFLDHTEKGTFLHDFAEYGGKYLEKIEENRQRAAAIRAARKLAQDLAAGVETPEKDISTGYVQDTCANSTNTDSVLPLGKVSRGEVRLEEVSNTLAGSSEPAFDSLLVDDVPAVDKNAELEERFDKEIWKAYRFSGDHRGSKAISLKYYKAIMHKKLISHDDLAYLAKCYVNACNSTNTYLMYCEKFLNPTNRLWESHMKDYAGLDELKRRDNATSQTTQGQYTPYALHPDAIPYTPLPEGYEEYQIELAAKRAAAAARVNNATR